MPLIRVNSTVIDASNMRCVEQTQKGERCLACAGENGIIEIATSEDGTEILKVDVTCGTHVNFMAGNDTRYIARDNAINSARMVNRETA